MAVTTPRKHVFRSMACFAIVTATVVVIPRRTLEGSGAEFRGEARAALQRIKMGDDGVYFFDFAVPRGPGIPALEKLPPEAGEGHNEPANAQYYIFGAMEGANTLRFPLRWDIVGSTLFCTFKLVELHQPTGPSLFRYPLDALVEVPDDGRLPIDTAKLGETYRGENRLQTPHYVSCGPIGGALQGFHRGWKEGTFRVGEPAKVVHYDIRGIDDTQVELFMTADGELFRWLFDGKTWAHQRNYPQTIVGEFLVLNEGRSLVYQQDDKYVVLSDIEEANPATRILTGRIPGAPLVLFEDKVEKSTYFEHGDELLDWVGRLQLNLPRSGGNEARRRAAIDFILSRRNR